MLCFEKVLQSATVRPGQCFVPMHWGGNTMGGQGVNVLIDLPVCLGFNFRFKLQVKSADIVQVFLFSYEILISFKLFQCDLLVDHPLRFFDRSFTRP